MKPNYYRQIKSGQMERECKLMEQKVKKKKDIRKKEKKVVKRKEE